MRVRNVGSARGREVAQLYLAYPAGAGEPPFVLRGFESTGSLAPGEAAVLTFRLSKRDLSVWSEEVGPVAEGGPEGREEGGGGGGWRVAEGAFGLSVGASSRDPRLRWSVQVRCGEKCDHDGFYGQ